MATYRIIANHSNLNAVLRGAKRTALVKAAKIVVDEARRRAPHASGRLAESIEAEITPERVRVVAKTRYASAVEKGSGIYGYTGHPIYPRGGRVLVFTIGGRKIFAAHVQGQRPQPFLKPALETLNGKILTR